MQRRSFLVQSLGVMSAWGSLHTPSRLLLRAEEPRMIHEWEPRAGQSAAVTLGPLPWAISPQVLPLNEQRSVIAPGDPQGQLNAVVTQLERALQAAGSSLEQIVRLHVAVTAPEVVPVVQTWLHSRSGVRPATTFVETPLPVDGALLAIDAIAAVHEPLGSSAQRLIPAGIAGPERSRCHTALVPPGRKMYIAGQAEPGDDLAAATRATLAGLRRTLDHFGLGLDRVVQARSFLNPMSGFADVERETVACFGADQLPPQIYVEWTYPRIEIEWIVALPEGKKHVDPLTFDTPPWMTSSPIFSRVATVNAPTTTFIGGLYGPADQSGTEQVRAILDELRRVSELTGSDLKHLAKATYYVSGDESSGALNRLRPDYYDPRRPPSASKAGVRGVGRAGCSITIDMIAAPRG